jgi:uncharacterized protein YueI
VAHPNILQGAGEAHVISRHVTLNQDRRCRRAGNTDKQQLFVGTYDARVLVNCVDASVGTSDEHLRYDELLYPLKTHK